jgi:hypothetical protein
MNKMTKRRSLKRRSLKRKSLKRKSLKRKSLKRKSLKRRNLDGANVKDIITKAKDKIIEIEEKLKHNPLDKKELSKFDYNEVIKTVMNLINTDITDITDINKSLKKYIQSFFVDEDFTRILIENKVFKKAFYEKIKIYFFNDEKLNSFKSNLPIKILPNVIIKDYVYTLKDENGNNIYFKSDFYEFLDNYYDIFDIFNISVDEKGTFVDHKFDVNFLIKNYKNYIETHVMTPETYKLLHIIIRTKILNYILAPLSKEGGEKRKFEINVIFINLITENNGLDVFNILKQENDEDGKKYFIM